MSLIFFIITLKGSNFADTEQLFSLCAATTFVNRRKSNWVNNLRCATGCEIEMTWLIDLYGTLRNQMLVVKLDQHMKDNLDVWGSAFGERTRLLPRSPRSCHSCSKGSAVENVVARQVNEKAWLAKSVTRAAESIWQTLWCRRWWPISSRKTAI